MPKFVKANITAGRSSTDAAVRDLITPDKRVGKLVPLDEIAPNPNQPRKHFDKDTLEELADSIRRHGLINPITVDDSNVIIAVSYCVPVAIYEGERGHISPLRLPLENPGLLERHPHPQFPPKSLHNRL